MAQVGIVMGSDSDMPVMSQAAAILDKFGISYEMKIISAHREPDVFFDYANLRRPMIFYMYDKEEYADDIRGFYLDLEELPGPIVQTEEELL